LNGAECGTILVEGAGGLLSPFGHLFDSRDLLLALQATPLIVIPNRLGAVNQTRLVWEALPASARKHARIVLTEPTRSNLASRTNHALIARFVDVKRIHSLPRLSSARPIASHAADRSVRTILGRLLAPA
jgi:dethiobiotin synthetase